MDLVLRDPFARPVLSPLVKPARQDLWRGVPLAVDEVGATRTVPLIYHSLLVGGLLAAGKSVILTSVMATAGLDPGVDLWLIDPKRVEHRPWVGLATRHEDTVMDDGSGAIQLLRDLRVEIATRTGRLVDEHRKKITPGVGGV